MGVSQCSGMPINHSTRRAFLADAGRAAMAAWLSLQLPWLASLEGCTREDAPKGGPYAGLTPAETTALEAFAAQIFPSVHGTPGAVELGAVRFADRALGTPFFAPSVPVVRAGLADLDSRARALGGRRGFAALAAGQQVAILRQIEHGDFFKAARTLVLIGTFADPSYGGNRARAGWAMIGIDHRPSYSAPFGYYDAQASTARGAA
jgi:gluconate 2-dehydrogenase gamma chain